MPPDNNFTFEVLYTHRLADNDSNIRNKALKKLQHFLMQKSSRNGFCYNDFIKIWKGLYYCLYNADKLLFQEEVAEDISQLIHQVMTNEQKVLFFKVAMDTFAREWSGIDNFRRDKYFMLFTRILRQCLFFLKSIEWNTSELHQIIEILESTIICPYDKVNATPLGLKMHLADVILEELSKVGTETLPDNVLLKFIYPFLKVIAFSNQMTYKQTIQKSILDALIKQSDLGIMYEEGLTPKEMEMTSNTADGDEMEEVEEKDEDEDDVFELDPRAGGVDVYLPQLKPDYRTVVKKLQLVKSIPEIPQKNRRILTQYELKFGKLVRNKYPMVDPDLEQEKGEAKIEKKIMVKEGVKNLINLIKNENSQNDEEPTNKKRKREEGNDEVGNDYEMIKTEKKFGRKKRKRKQKQRIGKKLRKKLIQEERMRKTALANKLNSLGEVIGKLNDEVPHVSEENNKSKTKKKKNKSTLSSPLPPTPLKEKQKKKKSSLTQEDSGPKGKNKASKSIEANKVLKGKNRKAKKIKKKATDPHLSTECKIAMEENAQNTFTAKPQTQNPKKKLKLIQMMEKTPETEVTKLKKIKKKKKEQKKGTATEVAPVESCSATKPKTKVKKTDPWEEPLKKGETEFMVLSRKFGKKQKQPKTLKTVMKKIPKMNTNGKILKINLGKNKEHHWKDYVKVLKLSPGIPYSANKKPLTSALKSNASPKLKTKLKTKFNILKSKYNL